MAADPRALAEAVLGLEDGPSREALTPGEAAYYLGDNLDVSRALGIPVDRTDRLPRGRFLMLRTPDARIVVGTRVDDPLEAVRRDVRRWVRAGLRPVTPWPLRLEHERQQRDEDLIDRLVGSAPAWPA